MPVDKRILLCSLIFSASSSFAQTTPVVAAESRAEVKSETIAAEKAGQGVGPGEHSYPATATSKSKLTRKKVKSDTAKARAKGELRDSGEGNDEPRQDTSTKSSVSRAAVKADTVKANKAGELIPAGDDIGERAPHAPKTVKPKT